LVRDILPPHCQQFDVLAEYLLSLFPEPVLVTQTMALPQQAALESWDAPGAGLQARARRMEIRYLQ
jgi:hypothetical protein